MKRSEINVIIRDATAFFRLSGFNLPPFASWVNDDNTDNRSKIEWVVVHFNDSDDVLDLVTGRTLSLERVRAVIDAGVAMPDHILNTKRSPLWIEPADLSDAQAVTAATRAALEHYRRDYRAYFEQHQQGQPQLTSLPRVVLVAGLGMFAVGKGSRAAIVSSDIYHHTIAIVEGAERIGTYQSLSLAGASSTLGLRQKMLRRQRCSIPQMSLLKQLVLCCRSMEGCAKHSRVEDVRYFTTQYYALAFEKASVDLHIFSATHNK